MKKIALLLALLCVISIVPAEEAPDADVKSIRATVANYLEGWFSSDAKRMTEALHPNLVKYRVKKVPGSETEYLEAMGADSLIAFTAHNQEWVKGKKTHEMKIVYRDDRIAVVHAVSDDFYDICNLARINGEWKIVQVLWGMNEKKE